MNRIYKTIITLAALAAAVSCYKEPVFEFAEDGPDMTVSCAESALMGGNIDFTADIYDQDYPLSVLKAKLYWDLEVGDPVSEFEVRTTSEGTYAGKLAVPFEKDLVDGVAAVVFEAVNTHLGVSCDTVYVAINRPTFDQLTLASGNSWRRSLTPVEGKQHE